jgi:hypothetical protein
MFKRVAKCENVELRKNFKGQGAVYLDGKIEYRGSEYNAGRKYLDLKAKK